jgi:hypothetical protein
MSSMEIATASQQSNSPELPDVSTQHDNDQVCPIESCWSSREPVVAWVEETRGQKRVSTHDWDSPRKKQKVLHLETPAPMDDHVEFPTPVDDHVEPPTPVRVYCRQSCRNFISSAGQRRSLGEGRRQAGSSRLDTERPARQRRRFVYDPVFTTTAPQKEDQGGSNAR